MICKEKYDIIFLDHMMPEMDGIETLKAMKQSDQEVIHNKDTMEQSEEAIEQKSLDKRFPTLNIQVGLGYCMDDEDFRIKLDNTIRTGG